MKTWDLNSGAAKLEQATGALIKAVRQAEEQWNDSTYQALMQEYIHPLEPKVRSALDAVRKLEQILATAQRACRSE